VSPKALKILGTSVAQRRCDKLLKYPACLEFSILAKKRRARQRFIAGDVCRADCPPLAVCGFSDDQRIVVPFLDSSCRGGFGD
jgi:hypothetical protein